jgi:hypothetical protein
MEWGAMPVSIGLAGAYAAVMVGLDHFRTRQRGIARPAAATADLPAVDPAHVAAAATDPSVPVALEQSA